MSDKTVYSYINDIAQRLKEPRKYGDVSLMIGAGFSKNAQSKGMASMQPPNWSELAEKMYEELYPEPLEAQEKEEWNRQRIIKTSGKNVTKLADEYIANFDRNKINNLIEQSIADETFVPGELHKRLLKLHWSDIFTTNYDTLLERTVDMIYRENNYEIIYSQNDLPGSIKPRIIKLHGSIPQVKPYIISDEDYRTYPDKYSALVNTVQQAMLETRLCLLGFSGDDPNFQSWLGWLRDNMGEYCPTIYLIGIYEKLSAPERKLLENKGITIVDISGLVSRQEENRHYQAISEFVGLLEKNQSEKDIYLERPYQNVDIFWQPKEAEKEEYFEKLENYSHKVEKLIEPYILLPEEKRVKYADYFLEHFGVVLKLVQNQEKVPEKIISTIIKILRKCLVVLEDKNAEYLEKVTEILIEKNLQIETLCEVLLYLAEMYRIDGKKELYDACMERCEIYCNKIPYYKNEFLIEKMKNYISLFDYEEAKTLIEEIETPSFEYKVKKAALYKQLSKNDIADKILSECSAELAQMKLSDEIYASYLGYLNLCYRIGNWEITEKYSDNKYYDNSYNTRRIIVEQREKLKQDFFEKDRKKEERIVPFSLNSNKSVTVFYSGETACYKNSFVFILGIDKLCLPMFLDQARLLPRVYDEIMHSSEYVYWKLCLAIRTNQEKIINQIFTRKMLLNIDDSEKQYLFDKLVEIVKMYSEEDSYDRKQYFVSMKNILSILSRLVVFTEDANVIVFLKILSRFSQKEDSFIVRDIKKILQIISTRFNGNIAMACQNIIFSEFDAQYHLASYFNNLSFEICEEDVEVFYEKALRLSSSENISERDNGLACLLVLWNNKPLEKYRDDIVTVFWKNDKDTLPMTELYYPFIWEELPHPASVEFSKLYYTYLMNTEYVESVTPTGREINNSYGSVRDYFSFFYSTSEISQRKCNKVILNKELANTILTRSYDFIMHEKSLLEHDFMGEKEDCENKFLVIGELVALVYCESIQNQLITEIYPLIERIKIALSDCKISTIAIDIVEMTEKNKLEECVDTFENIILTKNKKLYSSVFTGIQCLVFMKENYNQDVSFEKFFSSIKYLDIEYSKTLWIHLTPLLRQPFFATEKAQRYIALSINKCIDIYENLADQGERYYLDGLYNCVEALHQYYKSVKTTGTGETDELKQCVEKARKIKNYEIANIWSYE